MPDIPVERIKQIKSFPSLVKFLRDDLDWPLGSNEIDELVFEYEPDELGIEPEIAVKIKEIKQLRPLKENQPWGIFYIGFEPKRLPVVVLRRVLQKLVIKKRQSAESAHRNAWELHDLLFVSSYGEENQRAITFAHFSEDDESKLPTLRVIGWDSQDTPLHIDRCISELESLTFDEELSPDDWREQWSMAFTLRHREVISTSKALAKELAALATRIRQRVNKVLAIESKKGPMRQLYKAFQETLVHDLDEDRFADMYAQTITYGLFSARCSRQAGFVAENLTDMIPVTNPFLKELLSTFLTIGGRKGKIDFDELGIDDVVQMLRDADMDAVLRDFGDSKPEEDPVIHFYEDFLKQYDAHQKIKRGAFYTPRPVVSFIVRSVDEILRKDFGLEDGLADTTTWGQMQMRNKDIEIPDGVSEHDPFVQVLDPATGTGTFLVEVIDLIYKTMKSKWEKEGHMPLEFNKLWNEYIPKHLLPRLYGFELMMAPYAIAHMKIGLKLFETGYHFGSDERARIYLTNTLEEPKDISEYFEQVAPALAHEALSANKVKSNTPTTVIVGNPPYSKHSANKGKWISDLVREYYKVDGKPLGEKNPKWLQDDYVKFIRFGQWRIKQTGRGILAFITNHGYLDNPTFRGMRQQLIRAFFEIYIFDLHGNSKKKESCPDGSPDKNVFDIQQGVTLGIFVENKEDGEQTKVYRADAYGTRKDKYNILSRNSLQTTKCEMLQPCSPYYLFIPQKRELWDEYDKYIKVTDIFPLNAVGFQTHRDYLVLSINKEELIKRMGDFISKSNRDEEVREKYFGHITGTKYAKGDTRDWKLSDSRIALQKVGQVSEWISKCIRRPFDFQWYFYHPAAIDYGRPKIMWQLIRHVNRALLWTRPMSPKYEFSVFCVSCAVDQSVVGNKAVGAGGTYVGPLYLYPETNEDNLFEDSHWPTGKDDRVPNLSPELVEAFAKKAKLEFVSDGVGDLKKTFGPEDVFHYIYAVFHSPGYCRRYAEFLKIDFPRVPITSDAGMFKILCGLGNELVSLHLMESDKLNDHITTFPVSGDNAVTKVGEKGKTLADVKNGKGKLYINKTQYFDNLPEEVWNFHIGGYQVCYKWLYDRKKAGRKLSKEDVEHYHRIVVAINETIKIMKEIDEVIDAHGGWPIGELEGEKNDWQNRKSSSA